MLSKMHSIDAAVTVNNPPSNGTAPKPRQPPVRTGPRHGSEPGGASNSGGNSCWPMPFGRVLLPLDEVEVGLALLAKTEEGEGEGGGGLRKMKKEKAIYFYSARNKQCLVGNNNTQMT